MRVLLTDEMVDELQLPHGKDDLVVFDTQQPTLALRLRAAGSKTWYHWYPLGKLVRHDSLGRLNNPYNLNDAREEVNRRQRLVKHDCVDPQALRRKAIAKTAAAANTPLFAIAVGEFLNEYRESVCEKTGKPRRPATLRNMTGWLQGPHNADKAAAYCAPLNDQRVDLITDRDVADLITSLKTTRSRQVAQSVRARLQAFFKWAMARKYVTGESPVKGVTCPAPTRHSKRKPRVLSTAEIVAIWNALGDDQYGKLTKLTILMGVRRQEIGAMRWTELDLDAGVWTIPGERTKTHETYVTPLAPAVVAILRSIEKQDGRDLVFGSRSASGFTQFSGKKRQLGEAAAIEPWRFHDLRATINTHMRKDLKILPHVRQAVLNHAAERNIMNEHYDDGDYAPEKREALEKWADYVTGLVSGKVVPFERKAA